MLETFIYAVGISLVLLLAWIGYELYKLRYTTEQVAIEIYLRGRDTRKLTRLTAPDLFDQEAE